jgi:hypothetical protein
MVPKESITGRLYPRVTIDALPDNVLLETFEFYLGKDDADELTTPITTMDGKRCYTFATDGDVSCLLHHVGWT